MTHSSQASGAPWSLERLIPVVTRHAKQLHRKQLRSYFNATNADLGLYIDRPESLASAELSTGVHLCGGTGHVCLPSDAK